MRGTPLVIEQRRAASERATGLPDTLFCICRASFVWPAEKSTPQTSCAVNQSVIILAIVRAGARVNEQTKAEISCAAGRESERCLI